MAVQEQTPLQEYTANGIAKQFDLEFDCESADHLIVSIDDLEVLHTDWYLSGNAIVFHIAPANGKQVKIQRNTPFNRLADYQSYNNSFRPPVINKDFDRIWWKLQELGVADWILSNRISALKAYVDDRDDELRAYLMEEIRKQGVALDQLDEYYNYLMQRLAQIAVDKGWDASFVVDGHETQKEINETRTIVVSSIFELITLNQNQIKPKAIYKTKAFYDGNNYGSAFYYWDSTKSKLDANGGTIIDPANTGGFDGTYTTIESFLAAQGAGIGTGCWVCTSSKADTTRFGLHKSYDISAPLQKAINYAKTNRNSGLVLIPEGRLTLSNKVTVDIGGTIANSITIRGFGPQTEIMSNIVGDTAFEFINAFSSSVEDLGLYGNGREGLSGSGHGIAFKSTGTSEDKTNNSYLKNVVVRGFKGHDTDEYGAGIRAAGVYLGRSVTCRFHALRAIDNFAGVYLQVAEQVTFHDFVGYLCIFASVLAVECVNTLNFYNADLVGVLSTTPVEINGVSLTPASIVAVDAALDTAIMLRDTKAKGYSSIVNSYNCPKVTLDGGTFLLYGTNHDAIKIASRTDPWDLCVKNLLFMGQSPSTQVKVVQATSTSTGLKSKLTVKDNLFRFGGQWDYAIKVVNNSTTDRTKIHIDNNRIIAHEGSTKSQLNAFLEVHKGVPRGVFTNNLFSVNDLYNKGNTIVDVVKLVSTTAQPEIKSKLNVYDAFSGTIVNKFGDSSVSGTGAYTSTTGGLIIIPVSLNANPVMVSAQLNRFSNDLRLCPDTVAAQTKDNLRFYAYKASDGLPYIGTVNMYYEAKTLP